MNYITTVKVVVDDQQRQPISGLQVSLFDRDHFSSDDLLGSGTTDGAGEATIRYDTAAFTDLEEKLSGDLPDLCVTVYGRDGNEVLSNRCDTVPNQPRRHMTVCLPPDLVREHGLLTG